MNKFYIDNWKMAFNKDPYIFKFIFYLNLYYGYWWDIDGILMGIL